MTLYRISGDLVARSYSSTDHHDAHVQIVPAVGLEGDLGDPTFIVSLEGLRAGVAVHLQPQVLDHTN